MEFIQLDDLFRGSMQKSWSVIDAGDALSSARWLYNRVHVNGLNPPFYS